MPSFRIARSSFERLPLERVEVIASARSGAGSGSMRHVFEPGAAEPAWAPAEPVATYRLAVTLAGATFDSPDLVLEAEPVVVIDLRIFDARALPWTTIDRVDVLYHDLSGEPRTASLTEARPVGVVFGGLDYPPGEPIRYSLDYRVADGNFLASEEMSSAELIPVVDPFETKTVTFEAVGVAGSDPAVQLVQLGFSHQEEGPGWRLAGGDGSTQLTAAQPTRELVYRVVDPARALTRYRGTVIWRDGKQEQIPEAAIPETRIEVGDVPLWWTVTIDPSQIDWTRSQVVVVQLAAGEPAAEPQGLAVFWRGMPSQAWSFQVPMGTNGTTGTTAWRAWYVREVALPTPTSWATTGSHRLVLPAAPGAGSRGA